MLEDAVTAFGRAVDIDGDRADSWYALGDALARLGRTEPARDALRRALTLGIEPWFNARVYAALGRVHAGAGEWTAAARSLRKALDLAGPGEDDRGIALDYGRVLGRLGDRGATEWLTRAARAPDARGPVIVEAAAATVDHEKAEALLREGLDARCPAIDRCARRWRGGSPAWAAPTRRSRSPRRAWRRRPTTTDGLGALRDSFAAAARWNDALRVAADEAAPGHAAAARSPRPPRPRRRGSRRPRRAGSDPIPSPREAGRGLGRGLRRPRRAPAPGARRVRRRPRRRAGDPAPRPPRARPGGARLPGARPDATAAGGPARRPADLDVRPVHDHAAPRRSGRRRRTRGRSARSPAAGRGDGRVQRRQVVVRQRAVRRRRGTDRRHADDRDGERAPLRRRARRARRRATTAARARCPPPTSRAS